MNYLLISGIAATLAVVTTTIFVLSRCVRCPSNKILCVFGRVGGGRSVRCYQGGFTFVMPVFQEARFLDLTPMTINIPLKGALSQQNIRVNVPSTFTIAVSSEPDVMSNAAVRLLDLEIAQIENMAAEIIFGQLRLTIASLTIEEINQDRERFLTAIRSNVEPELKKIGLSLINVNITDITDESGYIESIGKKAAATAINQAKVDVAEQEKMGEIGRAEAERERRVRVSTLNAEAVEGENVAQAKVAEYNASLAEKQAEARRRSETASEIAEAEIQKVKYTAEQARLAAEEVVPQEIERQKIEISADAEAARRRKEAAGEADAILAVRTAEAEGIRRILDAKSGGYSTLVTACGKDPREAATMLLVEKLEELVGLQTAAISNLKIDKVTVWDGGTGEKGSSTAQFVSSLVKSFPPLQDLADMVGVELPNYLGRVKSPAIGIEGTASSKPEGGPNSEPNPWVES